MSHVDRELLTDLAKKLYDDLKSIEDNIYWLDAQMHTLSTEERQKEMIAFLENKTHWNFIDVQKETDNIARRNPIGWPKVYREDLSTELEKRLYDKLIQIYDSEWWLAYIFDSLPTEELQLVLLDYLNEGNDNWADIWEFVGLNAIKFYHRNLKWK